MTDEEKTGYKSPPKHSQFKPGQSGNPKGRKRGQPNLKTDLKSLMKKRVTIREDGQMRRVSRQEAMLLTLFDKAIRGDIKASTQITSMLMKLEAREPPTSEVERTPITDTDRAIVDDFLRRHKARRTDPA